jgi:hypothetical protein
MPGSFVAVADGHGGTLAPDPFFGNADRRGPQRLPTVEGHRRGKRGPVPRRAPNTELRPREYLTEREIERLQETARKRSRYGNLEAR